MGMNTIVRIKRLRIMIKQEITVTQYNNEQLLNLALYPESFWFFFDSKNKTSKLPAKIIFNNQFSSTNKIVNGFANFFLQCVLMEISVIITL